MIHLRSTIKTRILSPSGRGSAGPPGEYHPKKETGATVRVTSFLFFPGGTGNWLSGSIASGRPRFFYSQNDARNGRTRAKHYYDSVYRLPVPSKTGDWVNGGSWAQCMSAVVCAGLNLRLPRNPVEYPVPSFWDLCGVY
jgi:hypothetical protein